MFSISFASSDGPAKVTFDYIDNGVGAFPIGCHAVMTGVVSPVAPAQAKVSVRRLSPSQAAGRNVESDVVRFSVQPASTCYETEYLPVKLTLMWKGRRYRTRADEPCEYLARKQTLNFSLYVPKTALGDPLDELYFEPDFERRGTHRIRYSLTVGTRVAARGRIVVDAYYLNESRIYKGSDDFQNVCRNRHKTIYQENGRKYCIRYSGGMEHIVRLRRL